MRWCETCLKPLEARADARFCGSACRQRAYRERRRSVTADWRVAAALLVASFPEDWAAPGERDDPFGDVFAEIDADVSALAEP